MRIDVYAAAVNWVEDAEAERELERYTSEGFPRIKVKIANPVKEACRRIERLRNRAGDEIALCVDANWAYTLDEAVEVGGALSANGYFWFEEPLAPENEQGYEELRKRCDVPLAAGESNFTADQAQRLLVNRTLSILQPDVARAGGISETRRMAEYAGLHDVGYAPHIGMSGIVCETASVHLAAALPNFRVMECECDLSPFKRELANLAPGGLRQKAARSTCLPGQGSASKSIGTPSSGYASSEGSDTMTTSTLPTAAEMAEAMLLAMLRADPALSRFDPLPRLLSFDDFSRGHCGWSQLAGNYEDTLDSMLPGYAQHSSAMLSTLSHWDAGPHGGMDSSYALKIATKPKPGAQNVAIKRHTFRERGPIRFEMFFTFKPEATELKLSETDVRSVGFLFDLQCGDRDGDGERVMPHLRFLNAEAGKHIQKWQYKRQTTPFEPIGGEDKTVSHYHLSPEGWLDLPGGDQRLCYNEIPTKVNWSYLRFDFDLATMKATGLQCNDRSFDLSGFDSIRIPAMKNLWCMLNFCLFAETDTAKRAFLYVDSVCISGDF